MPLDHVHRLFRFRKCCSLFVVSIIKRFTLGHRSGTQFQRLAMILHTLRSMGPESASPHDMQHLFYPPLPAVSNHVFFNERGRTLKKTSAIPLWHSKRSEEGHKDNRCRLIKRRWMAGKAEAIKQKERHI